MLASVLETFPHLPVLSPQQKLAPLTLFIEAFHAGVVSAGWCFPYTPQGHIVRGQ